MSIWVGGLLGTLKPHSERYLRRLETIWGIGDDAEFRSSTLGDGFYIREGQTFARLGFYVEILPGLKDQKKWIFEAHRLRNWNFQTGQPTISPCIKYGLNWTLSKGIVIRDYTPNQEGPAWAYAPRNVGSYYEQFRRNLWLSGCHIETTSHERMEWGIYARKVLKMHSATVRALMSPRNQST